MINAGIVGLGWWGQNLVNSVQDKSESIKFSAGAVRHPDKVVEFSQKNHLEMYSSYDQMLSEADIDSVVLATPHSIHAEQMMNAVSAGKHIYCEKPFTMNKSDAEKVITEANKANLTVVV